MRDIRQMSVAMQRLVDFLSMLTNSMLLRNNTRAITTLERNCDFCWVRLTLQLGTVTQDSRVEPVISYRL
jgi:hypothetical protein